MRQLMEYKIISGRTVEIRRVMMDVRRGYNQHQRRGVRVKGKTSLRKILANERESVKNLARILNCNFKAGDLWLTLTYPEEALPESKEAAEAILAGILPAVKERGLILAVQGCEHINRSLCLEREDAGKLGLTEVWVKPHAHAGGAMITAYYEACQAPCMVEGLMSRATLGMDIGDTLIGMHLRPVAVPVHSPLRRIGEANLVLAYSRPRYVGGPRAQYEQQLR